MAITKNTIQVLFLLTVLVIIATITVYISSYRSNGIPQPLHMVPMFKVNNYADINDFEKYLIRHPIFGTFSITRPPKKKKVNILVIVSSAPKRNDRRQMIRQTWWPECKNNENVRRSVLILF